MSARAVDHRRSRFDDATADQVADAMFALSTRSRVQILAHLVEAPLSVKELTEATGMEQSAVSHQLRVLRDHLLVRVVERAGRRRVYGLQDEYVADLFEAALSHVNHRRRRTKGPQSARSSDRTGS